MLIEAAASVELTSARRAPILMGDQLRRALAAFIRAAARKTRLLPVLDDLDSTDTASIDVLVQLIREGGVPLFLLGLSRADDSPRAAQLVKIVSCARFRLPPLGFKSCARLVEHAFGEALAEVRAQEIIEHSEGNPFFLSPVATAAAKSAESCGAAVDRLFRVT